MRGMDAGVNHHHLLHTRAADVTKDVFASRENGGVLRRPADAPLPVEHDPQIDGGWLDPGLGNDDALVASDRTFENIAINPSLEALGTVFGGPGPHNRGAPADTPEPDVPPGDPPARPPIGPGRNPPSPKPPKCTPEEKEWFRAIESLGLFGLGITVDYNGETIRTKDPWLAVVSMGTTLSGLNGAIYCRDPIVLDLDHDGIDLAALGDKSALFDMDADGLRELTAWVSGDDGILVHDRNANGTIDDLTEVFSELYAPGVTTALAALKTLDGNADNHITAADTEFANLRVWRDLNGNGISDPGELFTLDALGIVSIDLQAYEVDEIDATGNEIRRRLSFTRSDSTTGAAADVALWVDRTGIYSNLESQAERG